jgi:hypothetical protein
MTCFQEQHLATVEFLYQLGQSKNEGEGAQREGEQEKSNHRKSWWKMSSTENKKLHNKTQYMAGQAVVLVSIKESSRVGVPQC